MRTLVPILVCLLIGSCGSGQPPASPPSDTGIELFVNPRKSLYVEPGMPLGELLERYAQRMGWSLLVPEAAREKLAARHCDFAQRIEVPFGSVHGFVESLVRANGLYLRFEHRAEPIVLQVLDPDDKQQGEIPANRMLVPLAEVPRWAAHPAHKITTQAQLPAGDSKALVSNLRAIFGENARGVVQQVGDTNTILFSGTGTEVARLVRVLDEASRPAPGGLPSMPVELTPWIELLRAPAKGLHLEDPSQKGLPIAALIEQYVQLMGWQLLADDDVNSQAKALRFNARMPLDVPPENVHAFVEGVLRANNLMLGFPHAQTPVLLQVTIAAGRGERLRSNAMDVACDELPRWADHTDFLIRTKLNLPGVDVRALANPLRLVFSDNRREQIVPLGADGLLITGYASEVARIAELFRSLVDEAAGKKAVPPPAVPSAEVADLLVAPPKGLRLEMPGQGDLKLLDLVEQYAQLMGWRVLMGLDTRNQLRTLKCGLALPLEVPAASVHGFVEGVLVTNDFVLSFAHTREPVLLLIQSNNVAGMGNPRSSAVLVPEAELPRWAGHPAFLVSSCVDLPGIDVRTLSNSLRQMFSDQATQQIIPMGNSNSLLVTGFGSDVASLVRMFSSLADTPAGGRPALPKFPAGDSGVELLTPPAKGLHLEKSERGRPRLIDLFDAYARLMGWRLLVDPDTGNQLRTLECGFTTPLDVAPEHVHAFVEGVARSKGLALTFAHTGDPVLLSVASTSIAGRGNPRRDAAFVPTSELPRWAGHPAFLISTCADLPGVDVRTLSNSLRQMFSDQATQQIIPVGNTDGLIVTGFAADVVNLLSSLSELGRGSQGLKPLALPAASLADRTRLFPLGATSFTLEAPVGREPQPIEVLEAFAKWTGRPLEISDEARAALQEGERKLAEPAILPGELAYPYVGLLLDRARCTLSPVPHAVPVKWVVDVARLAKSPLLSDLPTIPFDDIGAWSGYCATPFRSHLRLPDTAEPKRVAEVLRWVVVRRPGCEVQPAGDRQIMIVGTPQQIQAVAYAILQACEPAPEKR